MLTEQKELSALAASSNPFKGSLNHKRYLKTLEAMPLNAPVLATNALTTASRHRETGLSYGEALPQLRTSKGAKTRKPQFTFQQPRTTVDENVSNLKSKAFTPNALVKFADHAARREQTAVPKMSNKAEIFRMKNTVKPLD